MSSYDETYQELLVDTNDNDVEILQQLHTDLSVIICFFVFFVIVIILNYIYKFFNMIFQF